MSALSSRLTAIERRSRRQAPLTLLIAQIGGVRTGHDPRTGELCTEAELRRRYPEVRSVRCYVLGDASGIRPTSLAAHFLLDAV